MIGLVLCGVALSTNPPYPHPLVTEVLYAVPTGQAGDANGDGTRDANGDEFVELTNPHDKPIQLAGYILADKELTSKKDGKPYTSLRFKFPAMELQPGQVVVVFNATGAKGPVGTASAAPTTGNEHFHGALVLAMGAGAKQGFANKGDCVQVIAPDGKPVQVITWGDGTAPKNAEKSEQAPAVNGRSVARNAAGAFEPHPGEKLFSPGLVKAGTADGGK